MTIIWMLLLGVAGMFVVYLLVLAIGRWPWVFGVSIAISVVIAWEYPHPPPLAVLGGTSVYYADVVSVCVLFIAVPRLRSLSRNLGAGFWPWCVFGAMLSVSLISGLIQNPFGTTVNDFRSFFHLYAAATWAMSLTWNYALVRANIEKFSLVLGWMLAAVSIYHFRLNGLGSTSEFVDSGTGLEQTTRTLTSGQALMLLLCGILALWSWGRHKHFFWLISAVFFFSFVVVSQQRTVWVVGIAALVVVLLVAKTSTKVLISVFGVISLWFVAVVVLADFVPQLLSQLSFAASDSGTYDARVRSWMNLIASSELKGPMSVLFGQPMGAGYGRFEGAGRWVVFAPHNWYVTAYLRTGLVGLFALLVFLTIALAKLTRSRCNMVALAILTTIVVYGWSYSWPWYVGLFLGWAMVMSTHAGLPREETSQWLPSRPQGRLYQLKHIERR